MTGVPDPPPFEDFEEMVKNATLVESIREIRRIALTHAAFNDAWIFHLEFVEAFMRERGISYEEA